MNFSINSREDAVTFLNLAGSEPCWDSAENRAYFRRGRKLPAIALAPRQKGKKSYEFLIEILSLKSREDIKGLQAKLKRFESF